ncbi:MAG TPA: hypothetical protein PKY59_09580 [Pyrinomonadaceae bacterium]|nr:hypothetical protein [Pyrinomonadaceae bacterium]
MKVTESTDEIILQETPYLQWIISLVIAAFSFLFVYRSLSEMTDYFNLAWTLAIAVSGSIFFISLLFNPAITTKINKQKKLISIRKQSLVKYSFKVYNFDEVADLIYVHDESDTRGNKSYQMMLPLKDGSKIEISSVISSKESQYYNTAQKINSYVFDSPDQTPFTFAVFVDD